MEGLGTVRCLGGLRFSGWIAEEQDPAAMSVLVDGIPVDRVHVNRWRHVGTGDDSRAVRGFEVFLPPRFGDGAIHQFAVVTSAGENLGGSPITFVAFADGLREFVRLQGGWAHDDVRTELFDQLVPPAVPFARYQDWRENFVSEAEPASAAACGVVMVGPGATDETLDSLEQQSHTDWVAAALPAEQAPTAFQPLQMRGFLEGDAAGCAFIVFGMAGTVLAADALQRFAGAFSSFENACAVYGDLDLKGADGSEWPLALTAFDYERMLEQGYCAHLFAMRADVARRSLADGASDLYRLFNSILDNQQRPTGDIVHIPGSLGTLPPFDRAAAAEALVMATGDHLERRGVEATITAKDGAVFPAVRIERAVKPQSVTIVVPTRDRPELLEACVESLRPVLKRHTVEIIVVDNETVDPDALLYLAKIGSSLATVLRVPGSFNFARLNNRAAQQATGDLLCLLNNDVKAIDDEWLDEMLSRIGERDVGAVGALLLWPSGVVQHGGVVLGTSFAADHAFQDRVDGDPGYGDLLRVAHECSAVTAACMLTRRRDYLEVGGMDEVQFPVNFNDVDYCLKLRARGQRVVFTPHAKLVHHESASRGLDLSADRKARFEHELRSLRAKWGSVIAADPYYSPVLSRDPIPYSALAWPPGPMAPRLNLAPVAADVPPGF